MEIKITESQIMTALHDHIDENYSDTINHVLEKCIEKEVSNYALKSFNEKVEPIVLDVISKQEFKIHTDYASYYTKEDKLEKLVEYIVRNYLNSPHYIYSKDAPHPKDRYGRSSEGGSYDSLIELIVQDNIRKITNEEFRPQIDEAIDKFILERDKVADVISSQLKKFFSERIKTK